MAPALEVADIFRRHGEVFRQEYPGHLGYVERRIMGAITACRTAVLGGHVEQCNDRGAARIAYNSCRNRHKMPGTGARQMARGSTSRTAASALLPCRLHLAGLGSRDRVPEQDCGLRDAISRGDLYMPGPAPGPIPAGSDRALDVSS